MLEGIDGSFTAKDKRAITKDWELALKHLKKFKNMHMINTVGPLVVGVYLDMARFNKYYIPKYFVHNLCREFPAFTSTLRVKGKMITVEKHEEMYMREAEFITEQAFIPISGDLKIDKIIAGYERYFTAPNPTAITEYEDLALLCGWFKDHKRIEYVLNIVYNELKSWPEERYFVREYGSFEAWFKNLEERVWKGDELDSIFASELMRHKLTKIPERKILF